MKKIYISSLVVVMLVAFFISVTSFASNENNENNDSSINTLNQADETEISAVENIIETTSEQLNTENTENTEKEEYIDLTKMSSTMVYSKVYDMQLYPEKYIGSTVKATGVFVIYTDVVTKNIYTSVLVADAAACCSQGLEFVWAGEHTYPTDYPELETEITVTGTFSTYTENDQTYITLNNAELEY